MTIYLGLNALMYLILGIWCAVSPQYTSTAVGFEVKSQQGLAEYFAVYGGLEFALGLFFVFATLSDTHRASGLLLAVLLYGGLVAFRGYSILTQGSDIGNGWNFFALEVSFLIWGVILLIRGASTGA